MSIKFVAVYYQEKTKGKCVSNLLIKKLYGRLKKCAKKIKE